MLLTDRTRFYLLSRLITPLLARFFVNITLSCHRIRAFEAWLGSLRLFAAKILLGSLIFSFPLTRENRSSIKLRFLVDQTCDVFELGTVLVEFFDSLVEVRTIIADWVKSWGIGYRSIIFRVICSLLDFGLSGPL